MIFSISILCGCRSVHGSVVKSSYEKDSTLSEILKKVSSVTSQANNGVYTKYVFYDTSLPIDKETNKRPESCVIEIHDSTQVFYHKVDTVLVEKHDSIYIKQDYNKKIFNDKSVLKFYALVNVFIFVIALLMTYKTLKK